MPEKKSIIVAPLNWGLGHATRCIPLIRELIDQSFEVILASDGAALGLLQKEFPQLKSVDLPSYNIRYSKNGIGFKWNIVKRIPHLMKTVASERKATEKLIEEYDIGGIISDNRLGVYHPAIPTVFITHQVNVLSGITTLFSTKIHREVIKKFDECWVPDFEGATNLSGKLGHPKDPPLNLKYIGPLSRLKKQDIPIKNDVLFLLSGPEPQRAYLENRIIEIFRDQPVKSILVRGIVNKHQTKIRIGNMKVVNFMTSEKLERVMNKSKIIVSRSGYTTLMDLTVLEKKAFFIPTPGQYEQVYLAKRCQELGFAPFCNQKDFNQNRLKEVSQYKGFSAFNNKMIDYRDLFSLFKGK